MKLLILALSFASFLANASDCTVNIEYIDAYRDTAPRGITRLIKKQVEKKGYKAQQENALYKLVIDQSAIHYDETYSCFSDGADETVALRLSSHLLSEDFQVEESGSGSCLSGISRRLL
jgi:hypothetical protein